MIRDHGLQHRVTQSQGQDTMTHFIILHMNIYSMCKTASKEVNIADADRHLKGRSKVLGCHLCQKERNEIVLNY